MNALIGLMIRLATYFLRKYQPLPLSDDAKSVLERMQSDSSRNGIFADTTSLGDRGYSMACLYDTSIEIKTTHRVMAELEAKDLITITREDRDGFRDERVKLTHFGWRLNPKTGRADKVG